MINNNEKFLEYVERFGAFQESGELEKQELSYKKELIDGLSVALSEQVFLESDFAENFSDVFRRFSNSIINLTYRNDYDDFKNFLEKSDSKRLSDLFRGLFDEERNLAVRFDGFKDEINADYKQFLDRDKKITNSLIALFLTVRFPDKYTFYRPSMFNHFCKLVGLEKPTAKNSTGEAYAQYIEELLRETERTVRVAREWLRDNPDDSLPVDVISKVLGWTAAELMETYRPLYPLIAGIEDANRMTVVCSRYLRRIPNENFTWRFSSATREAAEYLFDRTDALLHAAIKWGGKECRYQALTARHELGLLRDVRFVLPELTSGDYDKRMAAVSCLAFLQSEEGIESLYNILQNDPIANVRQSALWALAFCKGKAMPESAAKITKNEDNEQVRSLAAIIARSEYEKVWFL